MYSCMEVLGQWKHGIAYPHWAAMAHWGYGEARFLFYPPASWVLGAVLGAILPWRAVPGAYCWIVLTLAGGAMYRCAREWLSTSDALFVAVFYALNPYHLLIVYWRSAYAELLAAALLPCVVLCLLRLNNSGDESVTLWLSLTLAASWLTNAPGAVMIQYSTAGLALFLAVHTLVRERSWNSAAWRPLVLTALAMCLGAGLASFYLLPAIYEQRWINISEVLSPGVRPQDNFLFTTVADPDHNRFNRLASTVAVSEIGALIFVIWFSRQSKRIRTADHVSRNPGATSPGHTQIILLSVWGSASAFLMLSVSNPFWQLLPKLQFVQLPFRWLLCLNAALAVLLAVAIKRWIPRLLVCAVLVATIIVAGRRFQPPWWELASDVREMSQSIAHGPGYEGTDEYVPAGVDPYNVDKSLPLVSDNAGAPVAIENLTWGPAEKHFTVHTREPEGLTVRLFNYPAWEVTVNGKPTKTGTSEDVGLMVIPLAAGDSDVQIHFGVTVDRVAGSIISLLSFFALLALWCNRDWINSFSTVAEGRSSRKPTSSAA
jgi:hypothetical protein